MSYICGHIGTNSRSIADSMVDNSFSKIYQYLQKENRIELLSCYGNSYAAYACDFFEHSSRAFIIEDDDFILIFEGNLFQISRQEYFRSIVDLVKKHERGDKCYLNGDYAFVLYTKKEKELRMYRSAMGGRPLYYRIEESGVSFASNLEQLVPIARASKYTNMSSLKKYIPDCGSGGRGFEFHYPPQKKTLPYGKVFFNAPE